MNLRRSRISDTEFFVVKLFLTIIVILLIMNIGLVVIIFTEQRNILNSNMLVKEQNALDKKERLSQFNLLTLQQNNNRENLKLYKSRLESLYERLQKLERKEQ